MMKLPSKPTVLITTGAALVVAASVGMGTQLRASHPAAPPPSTVPGSAPSPGMGSAPEPTTPLTGMADVLFSQLKMNGTQLCPAVSIPWKDERAEHLRGLTLTALMQMMSSGDDSALTPAQDAAALRRTKARMDSWFDQTAQMIERGDMPDYPATDKPEVLCLQGDS